MSETVEKSLRETIKDLSAAVSKTSDYFSQLDPTDLPNLLKSFKLLRDNRDSLKTCYELIEMLYKKCSEETIPNSFESMGFDSVKAHGKNFIVNTQLMANIPSEMREKGFEWLKENGLDGLIQNAVNAKSLSSAIKLYFENTAKLPPEDAIKTYQKRYTSIKNVS